MYLLVACDANRQTVPLVWGHFADNESDKTWDRFFAFVKTVLPELDASHIVIYRDGRSSISKALDAHTTSLTRFLCTRHGGEAAAHTVKAPNVAKEYNRMAMPSNLPHYQRIKSEVPSALNDYVARSPIPESQRFLAPFAAAGGKTQATLTNRHDTHKTAELEPRCTSQFVEVNMHSANQDGSRSMQPQDAVLTTAETWTRRMVQQQKAANECSDPVPPQVATMLANLESKAQEKGRTRVHLLGARQGGTSNWRQMSSS